MPMSKYALSMFAEKFAFYFYMDYVLNIDRIQHEDIQL